jgi:L-ribulose-5-phosphate 3-epimerase
VSHLEDRIGFMQGRLSPMVGGKIQAFPRDCWQAEFAAGRELGFARIEWTLDQDGLSENPLMTDAGAAEIGNLVRSTGLKVSSITGDCFMQAPFWKSDGAARRELLADFQAVVRAGARSGAGIVVVPLVDNGGLTEPAHETALIEGMDESSPLLRSTGVRAAFECDMEPERLAAFIARFPADSFGVNFDIGNSASLGWDPEVEIPAIGPRIINVHVKDRVRGGTTVALGQGNANFPLVFKLLAQQRYGGFFILQTARATDDDHAGVLARYRRLVLDLTEPA